MCFANRWIENLLTGRAHRFPSRLPVIFAQDHLAKRRRSMKLQYKLPFRVLPGKAKGAVPPDMRVPGSIPAFVGHLRDDCSHISRRKHGGWFQQTAPLSSSPPRAYFSSGRYDLLRFTSQAHQVKARMPSPSSGIFPRLTALSFRAFEGSAALKLTPRTRYRKTN